VGPKAADITRVEIARRRSHQWAEWIQMRLRLQRAERRPRLSHRLGAIAAFAAASGPSSGYQSPLDSQLSTWRGSEH
jgi:hypothetical protein